MVVTAVLSLLSGLLGFIIGALIFKYITVKEYEQILEESRDDQRRHRKAALEYKEAHDEAYDRQQKLEKYYNTSTAYIDALESELTLNQLKKYRDV